jgi:phosphate transport system substrate-binding protein
MKAVNMILGALALLVLLLWLMPDGLEYRQPVITVDGSSTVYPLTQVIAQQFQRSTGGVRVITAISGTGRGFRKFCRGETDIHDASRPITDEEMQACARTAVQYYELPVALDAITIVVNQKNTWANSMTLEELKAVWEPSAEGRVTRWQHIRANWPDRSLDLFGPGPDSGTFDYFSEVVVGHARASRQDYTASEDDAILAAGVATDEHALGYVPHAYFESHRNKLRALPLARSSSRPVSPDTETIGNGSYPLVRPVFIYVSRASCERTEVRQFVEYYLKHASTLTLQVGLSPLPARAYAMARDRVQNGQVGTAYGGETVAQLKIEEILARETRL